MIIEGMNLNRLMGWMQVVMTWVVGAREEGQKGSSGDWILVAPLGTLSTEMLGWHEGGFSPWESLQSWIYTSDSNHLSYSFKCKYSWKKDQKTFSSWKRSDHFLGRLYKPFAIVCLHFLFDCWQLVRLPLRLPLLPHMEQSDRKALSVPSFNSSSNFLPCKSQTLLGISTPDPLATIKSLKWATRKQAH